MHDQSMLLFILQVREVVDWVGEAKKNKENICEKRGEGKKEDFCFFLMTFHRGFNCCSGAV